MGAIEIQAFSRFPEPRQNLEVMYCSLTFSAICGMLQVLPAVRCTQDTVTMAMVVMGGFILLLLLEIQRRTITKMHSSSWQASPKVQSRSLGLEQ